MSCTILFGTCILANQTPISVMIDGKYLSKRFFFSSIFFPSKENKSIL